MRVSLLILVCVLLCWPVLVVAQHTSPGIWILKLTYQGQCASAPTVWLRMKLESNGIAIGVYNITTANNAPATIIVRNTVLTGLFASGRSTRFDVGISGQLFTDIGAGEWFNAYGCGGVWNAAKEQ